MFSAENISSIRFESDEPSEEIAVQFLSLLTRLCLSNYRDIYFHVSAIAKHYFVRAEKGKTIKSISCMIMPHGKNKTETPRDEARERKLRRKSGERFWFIPQKKSENYCDRNRVPHILLLTRSQTTIEIKSRESERSTEERWIGGFFFSLLDSILNLLRNLSEKAKTIAKHFTTTHMCLWAERPNNSSYM